MSRRRSALLAAVAVALVLAGCGSDPESTAASSTPASGVPAAAAEAPAAPDAKAVVDAFKAAGLPVTNIAEQDENTDPNEQLGRPGGYLSRASADLAGGNKEADKYSIERGLVVEVFATVEETDIRAKYIQTARQQIELLGKEYHYRGKDRRILVRITGEVKPSVAKTFEPVAAKL